MSYSADLEKRLDAYFEDKAVAKKKMFGGLCYLERGNMVCGVYKDFFIARVGEKAGAAALGKPHTRPFDITGKAMAGWVMVEGEGYAGKKMEAWIKLCEDFVETLPAK